jgi:hypothetical protein
MPTKSKMSAFQRGIVPIILQAILVGDRRIQSFVNVKILKAHDVYIDVRVSRSVWHIHAVKYVDAAPLTKRMMCYRVFVLIFRKRVFTGKKTKLFPTNLDVPGPQSATEAAIAFHRTIAEINSSFKPHQLTMATSKVCPQHCVLLWFWMRRVTRPQSASPCATSSKTTLHHAG